MLNKVWNKIGMLITGLVGIILVINTIPVKAEEESFKQSDPEMMIYEPKFNQTEARSMLDMINEFRKSDDAWYWNETDTEKVNVTGLNDLIYDYELEKVAMQRAAEIAIYWSHTRPDGKSPWSAYDDTGYTWVYAIGENIAVGQSSADTAFTSWCEDNEDYSGQGHRRNMLSSKFTAIGIACVTVNGVKYWVQEFTGNAPADTVTEANDQVTEVSVPISYSGVTDIECIYDPIEIEVDGDIEIPDVVFSVTYSGTWPKGKINVKNVPIYTADETFVRMSEDKIIGLAEGTGNIKAYLFGKEAEIEVTVMPASAPMVMPGDVDGNREINAKDVTVLRRYLAGGWGVTIDETVADINDDGAVNAKDVTMLRRFLAGGWGVELPNSEIGSLTGKTETIEHEGLTIVNVYDTNGHKKKSIWKYTDGNTYTYYYNDNDQVVREESYDFRYDHTTVFETEYDDAGNKVKYTQVNDDESRYEHIYDASGNEIKTVDKFLNEDGNYTVGFESVYEYNDKNQRIKRTESQYYGDYVETYITEYVYDEYENEIKKSVTTPEGYTAVIEHIYSESNQRLIKLIATDSDGSVHEYPYEYSEDGDEIKGASQPGSSTRNGVFMFQVVVREEIDPQYTVETSYIGGVFDWKAEWFYDESGKLIRQKHTESSGNVITRELNPDGEWVEVEWTKGLKT